MSWSMVAEQDRSVSRDDISRVDQVLDPYGNAMQRTEWFGRGVASFRRAAGSSRVDCDKCRQCRIIPRDPFHMRVEHLEGRKLPPGECAGERYGREIANALARCHRPTMPELGGNALVYFDPLSVEAIADTMTRALYDSALRNQITTRGLNRAAEFSWERCAQETLDVLVREQDYTVVFLHRIAPGSATQSYGIHVARLAGVPVGVLQRAQTVLAELETRHKLNAGPRPLVVPPPKS